MGDSINEKDLILINGCFCCNSSLYIDIPACIGCSGEGKVLCLEGKCCLKLSTPTLKCCCIDIGINKNLFAPICKVQSQYFCCVNSCALPPDDEVPMTLGYLGLFVYPTVGCCRKQALVMGR